MRNVIALLFVVVWAAGLGPGEATEKIVTKLPREALAISEYFYPGQTIHSRDGNEIGDVNDVLLDKDGRVAAVMVGVGGVLGAGEKNVAIGFEALELAKKGPKPYLVLDLPLTTLELAPGFEFDRAKRRWVPAAARLIQP